MGQSMQLPHPWLLWDVFRSVCCKQGRVGGVLCCGNNSTAPGWGRNPRKFVPWLEFKHLALLWLMWGGSPILLHFIYPGSSWQSWLSSQHLPWASALLQHSPFLSHPFCLPNIHCNIPTGSPLPQQGSVAASPALLQGFSHKPELKSKHWLPPQPWGIQIYPALGRKHRILFLHTLGHVLTCSAGIPFRNLISCKPSTVRGEWWHPSAHRGKLISYTVWPTKVERKTKL